MRVSQLLHQLSFVNALELVAADSQGMLGDESEMILEVVVAHDCLKGFLREHEEFPLALLWLRSENQLLIDHVRNVLPKSVGEGLHILLMEMHDLILGVDYLIGSEKDDQILVLLLDDDADPYEIVLQVDEDALGGEVVNVHLLGRQVHVVAVELLKADDSD